MLELFKKQLPPEIANKLSPIQSRMFEAKTQLKIVQLPEIKLIELIGNLIKGIARDLGIRNIDQYDLARFHDVVRKYYSDLTLEEIKMAFEMLLTGELDNHLPTDQNGNPNRNHYQQFSVEFYTRILNAYRAKRTALDVIVQKALPEPESTITEQQKEHSRKRYLETMNDAFLYYAECKTMPTIYLPFLFVNRLIEFELIAETEKVTETDIAETITTIFESKGFSHNAKDAARQYDKGIKNDTVESIATATKNLQTIKNVFDSLIEKNETLAQYLWPLS